MKHNYLQTTTNWIDHQKYCTKYEIHANNNVKKIDEVEWRSLSYKNKEEMRKKLEIRVDDNLIIKPKDLFNVGYEKRKNKILIAGLTGFDKTTFCKHLAYQHSFNNLFIEPSCD